MPYTEGVAPPDSTPLARLLLDAFTWFDTGLTTGLSRGGGPELTRSQSLAMSQVSVSGSRSADIARNLGVTRQAVHQTVAELRHLGLVDLVSDPSNASAKLVKLTPEGRRSVRRALRVFEELEHTLGDRIGERDMADLRRILSKEWGAPGST